MGKPAQRGNLLGRTREVQGQRWVFRFQNGLVVHTDPFRKPGGDGVLPLGGPQDTLLNHLLWDQERVAGKRVLDPFAGSGVLGLMALRLGAAHADFVDVSPRALDFVRDNARRNGFGAARFDGHLVSLEAYEPEARCQLLLANPPFVPTPPGIGGSLTSAGGPDGNAQVEVLLRRLPELLAPEGEAFVYLMQVVGDGGPAVLPWIEQHVRARSVTLTRTQVEAIPLADYADAYLRCFADRRDAIEAWRTQLEQAHGVVGIQQYVMHVGPERAGETHVQITDDLRERYGILPYPALANRELALGRVMENLVS